MAEESKIDEAKLKRLDLPPHLVHQILLSGPKDAAVPIGVTRALDFEVYQENLLQDDSEILDQAFVVKRAFHDSILQRIEQRGDLSPLHDLLMELHQKLRGLVPNRPDLHGLLNDNREIPSLAEAQKFSTWIVDAARALAMLESEFQSETTKLWMSHYDQSYQQQLESRTIREQLSWMVCSLLFLIDKTDITQSEKDAFYFSSVVVPYLCKSGVGFQIERESLLQRFGSDFPVTRDWIWSLIQDADQTELDNLQTKSDARRMLIATGWIDTLLFQKHENTTIPEIFFLDVGTLRAIRNASRVAAAGCALGLHAVHISKARSGLLALEDESRGEALVRALRNEGRRASQQVYEQTVVSSVVSLAQELKGLPLTEEEIVILEGQTKQVMLAGDPVLHLLNDRIRSIFCELAVARIRESSNPSNTPKVHTSINEDHSRHTSSIFVNKAKTIFCARGLGFFATDLARAADLAIRVTELATYLWDKEILAIISSKH